MREKNKRDNHLFETTHPYFIELGLGSFTTGTLLDWWMQKDNNGNYLNRRHINPVNETDTTLLNPQKGLLDLLGISDADRENATDIHWHGWKPNVDTGLGAYKKQSLYDFGDARVFYGNESTRWSYDGVITTDIDSVNDVWNNPELQQLNSTPVLGVKRDETGEYPAYLPIYDESQDVVDPTSPLYHLFKMYGLFDLINLNKYMSLYDDYNPRGTWDKSNEQTFGPFTKPQGLASWAFLNEIKTSKSGPYVQWSGDITFYVSEGGGLISQCPITENVAFKLYLLDNAMLNPRSKGKSATFKNIVIVAPKSDSTGASPEEDGERVATDQDDVKNHAAGELQVGWNPVTRKFESGNENRFAKLVTDVPAGKAPSLEFLLGNDIKETLEDSTNVGMYRPGFGSGMLIRAQNGNPMQWSPNYAQTKENRCFTENKDKQLVRVANFNPRKHFPSGEEVMLTKIDGIWHVNDLGQGDIVDDGGAVATGVGKWGPFTYLATSHEFFFWGKKLSSDEYVDITPRDAELNFHYRYYNEYVPGTEERVLNFRHSYGADGGYNSGQYFDTSNVDPWYTDPGYLQITSFDFLDDAIGGIRGYGEADGAQTEEPSRNTCSIASTSALTTSAGKTIPFSETEYAARNAAFTGAFFGCVFPEGYEGTEIYDTETRYNDAFVLSTGSSGDVNASDYLNTVGDSPLGPFHDGLTRSVANRKCLAEQTDLETEITFQNSNWLRNSDTKERTMFALDATSNRKTIPADVMLNASPSGVNGSPIKPIGLIQDLTSSSNTHFIETNLLANAIDGGAWLYRRNVNSDSPIGLDEEPDTSVSAFDFKPVSNTRLMFRPLKLEAYLGLGAPDMPLGEEDQYSNLDSKEETQTNPKSFYAEICRTTTDKLWPVSNWVHTREFENCKKNKVAWDFVQNSETYKGRYGVNAPLKWGAWVDNKNYYSQIHEWDYWNESEALRWTDDIFTAHPEWTVADATWRGAGAYGVIGTNVKVSANTSIQFVTSNLYGMGAAAHGRFTIENGNEAQDRTWGESQFNSSYKQKNLIDLSVRVYQGHPSDQTIYDPRLFAVHHFNAGVAYANDKYRGTGVIPVNQEGQDAAGKFTDYPYDSSTVKPRNYKVEIFQNLRDEEGILLDNVKYYIPQPSGSDFRIPSTYAKHKESYEVDGEYYGAVHQTDGEYHPLVLGTGEYLLRDVTTRSVWSNGAYETRWHYPPLPSGFWTVETKRTGKLLPYRYYRKTLKAPYVRDPLDKTINPVWESTLSDVKVVDRRNLLNRLIIRDSGRNFAEGDIIGIIDKQVLIKVTQVYNHTNGDTVISGVPEAFEYVTDDTNTPIGRGVDIPPTFCQSKDDVFRELSANFKMDILSGSGQDLYAYFIAPVVDYDISTDPKPFLIKNDSGEINRIAADKPGPVNQPTTGFTPNAEAEAFVTEQGGVTVEIPPNLKSADGSYDCFFHFHNDITMTWLASASSSNGSIHGDFNNATECHEQHVTIDAINLT